MLIEKDCVVGIHVRMFDLQKNLLEETEPQGVTYLHGHGDIFPKLEQALEGKKAGETVVVQLEPDEAFGDFDDEAIRLVPVESLGDPELIVPGLVFSSVPGETPDGRNWRVTDVAEGMAVLDANHPLAGWSLKFEVKVLSVSKPEGEVTGNDEVVVPGFLGFAEKIIDDEAWEKTCWSLEYVKKNHAEDTVLIEALETIRHHLERRM